MAGSSRRAGLHCSTCCSVRFSTVWYMGVCMMGSRSWTPEIDSALRTSPSGRPSPISGHTLVSSRAASWPPAECPATVIRFGSPPWAATWCHTQPSAFSICRTMCGMVTGASGVPGHNA
ncbi:hypothetical protein D3C72_1668300 [compost metagenome]